MTIFEQNLCADAHCGSLRGAGPGGAERAANRTMCVITVLKRYLKFMCTKTKIKVKGNKEKSRGAEIASWWKTRVPNP